MAFNQAQSTRLGQRTPVESTYVQMYTGTELPEAAWHGQMIYRTDDQVLQIYDIFAADGLGAWREVVSGQAGQLTFVGAEEPVGAFSVGDVWYDSDDAYKQYIWDGDSWNPVAAGSGTFFQPNRPPTGNVGDFWVDSDDLQAYVFDGHTWLATTSSVDRYSMGVALNLVVQLRAYFGLMSARRTLYYQATTPTGTIALHDVWCDTDDQNVYDYTAGGWVTVSTEIFRAAVADMSVAGRFTADAKVIAYAQSTEPSPMAPGDVGDLWYSTSEFLMARIWNGVFWLDLQVSKGGVADGTIGNDQIIDSSVDASAKVVAGTIHTPQLANNVITFDKISDFAVAASKLNTQTHVIY